MTVDELYAIRARGGSKPSRFHKSPCPKCGEPITNQAMGRKSHMEKHKRAEGRGENIPQKLLGGNYGAEL